MVWPLIRSRCLLLLPLSSLCLCHPGTSNMAGRLHESTLLSAWNNLVVCLRGHQVGHPTHQDTKHRSLRMPLKLLSALRLTSHFHQCTEWDSKFLASLTPLWIGQTGLTHPPGIPSGLGDQGLEEKPYVRRAVAKIPPVRRQENGFRSKCWHSPTSWHLVFLCCKPHI